MNGSGKFDVWRCRFADQATERDYLSVAFSRNLSANRLGVLFGVPLFSIYVVLDLYNLSDPSSAIAIRLGAAAVAIGVLWSFKVPAVAKHQEWLTVFVIAVLGSAMISIIYREASLDNAYYVGLVQAAVIMSFLIRIGFEKAVLALLLMLGGFVLAVSGKTDTKEAVLQTTVLVTMFSICGLGSYVAERLRRLDFLKSQKIADQNRQLNALLADVQQDNARKVAAMNLLVHFVKTPIHQIVGFTDVIKRQIEGFAGEGRADSLESAAFIQSASRDLSRNVSKLLAYYRLDEKAAAAPDLIELDALILDHAERLDQPPALKLDKVAIVNRREIVSDAVQTMIGRYSDNQESAALVEVRLTRVEGTAAIVFVDQGPPVSDEEFARQIKPLDKLDHYLTANGSSMLLGLRTVARAVEICGGAIEHRYEGGRNLYFVEISDLASAAGLAAAAVA